MVIGELICIVGTALLTQLSPTTSTVSWAAYLVVAGIGKGMAMQLPYTAVQLVLRYVFLWSCTTLLLILWQATMIFPLEMVRK